MIKKLLTNSECGFFFDWRILGFGLVVTFVAHGTVLVSVHAGPLEFYYSTFWD